MDTTAALAKAEDALRQASKIKVNDKTSNAALTTLKTDLREIVADLQSTPEPTPTTSIEWGAWIDGSTYGSIYGDAPWDAKTVELFTQHTGKKPGIIHWGQPFGAMDLNALKLCKSYGAKPLVDTSLPVNEIVTGAKNAVIDSLANVCKSFGSEMIIRPAWEMNGTWFTNYSRNPNYVAAWKIFVSRIRAICGSQVKFLWCPNLQYDVASTEWIDKSWPGGEFVDYTGFDGYNFNTPWVTATQAFAATYDHIATLAPTKPMIIGETACAEAGDGGAKKAAWITSLLTTELPQNFPLVKGLVWFNWPIEESGTKRTWPIESSSLAQTAFKVGIASSYYKSGV